MRRDELEGRALRTIITLALAVTLATSATAQDQDFDPNDPMSVQRCIFRCANTFDISSSEYGACVEEQCNSMELRGLDTSGMAVLNDTDLPGGDIGSQGIRGVAFAECQAICVADERCVAVSWVEASAWCWPKSAVAGRQSTAGVRSALRD